MEYIVEKTEVINPAIDSPEWEKANVGYVDKDRWVDNKEIFPTPKTTFKLLRGPEGLSVLMHTEERNLRAVQTEENSLVCEDSCMEFFLKPSPWDERYFNFELNPKGVMHLGIGCGRYGRTYIWDDREIFSIESDAKDGDWTLKYYIPDTFIKKHFAEAEFLSTGNSSSVAKGNFFKCGEQVEFPHFAMWSECEVELPDFHIADFFGRIIGI